MRRGVLPIPAARCAAARRWIIIPRQLKAYGDTFSVPHPKHRHRLAGFAPHVVLKELEGAAASTQRPPQPSASQVVSPEQRQMIAARPAATTTAVAIHSHSGLGEATATAVTASALADSRDAAAAQLSGGALRTESFADMLLPRRIVHGVLRDRLGVTVPSEIQQLAIVPALQRQSICACAPSGTGKTLAVLAPLFANIVRDRDLYRIPLREQRPRALILAPTTELAWQLHVLCQAFDAELGTRTACFVGGPRANRRWKRLFSGAVANTGRMDLPDVVKPLPDVLICHPQRIRRQLELHRLSIDDLRYLVVDEADTMFSPEQNDAAGKLLSQIARRNLYRHGWSVDTQVLCATSLMSTSLDGFFRKRLPTLAPVIASGIHKPVETLRTRWLPCTFRDKFENLVYAITSSGNQPVVPPATHDPLVTEPAASANPITFPELDSCADESASGEVLLSSSSNRSAGHIADVPSTPAHSLVRWENQSTAPAPFTLRIGTTGDSTDHIPAPTKRAPGQRVIVFFSNIARATAIHHRLAEQERIDTCILHASMPTEKRRTNWRRWMRGECNVLLTTDAAGRGLDCPVDVVVNYDMPKVPSIYLTRVGRTARMGRRGTAINLHTKHERTFVDVVKTLTRSGQPLGGTANAPGPMRRPQHKDWVRMRKDALTRRFVGLITHRKIPTGLEKVYLKHNATFRRLWKPHQIAKHAGVDPKQQYKLMDKIAMAAWDFRRDKMARKKRGPAKFGKTEKKMSWNSKQMKREYHTDDRSHVASDSTLRGHETQRPSDMP